MSIESKNIPSTRLGAIAWMLSLHAQGLLSEADAVANIITIKGLRGEWPDQPVNSPSAKPAVIDKMDLNLAKSTKNGEGRRTEI